MSFNVLVVDFDFFFENKEQDPEHWMLYDWGHREAPFFIDGPLWVSRAASFLRSGLELPGTTGEEEFFWDRFDIAPDAEFFVCESNALAASPLMTRGNINEVWLYDAHHDAGYSKDENEYDLIQKGVWSCENWMVLYSHIANKTPRMRYPEWRAWAMEGEPEPLAIIDRQVEEWGFHGNGPDCTFNRVFICRSGAWVPPWLDRAFIDFVASCPVEEAPTDLGGDIYPCLTARKNCTPEAIEQWLEMEREVRSAQQAHGG